MSDAAPPPLAGGCGEHAVFLDFDGTLVDLAATPDAVSPDAALVALLGALSSRLGGALAIVTGREIATIDRLLAPLRLAVAGLHGIERRRADGTHRGAPDAPSWIALARAALRRHVTAHPGLLLEDKGLALAVHYRAAPSLRRGVERLLHTQCALACGQAEILEGACLLELRPTGRDKGSAIDEFMAEPPFAGRRPVFAGDDRADLAGLAAVQRRGGIAIAVGGRVTAPWRLAGSRDLRSWLDASFAPRSSA